MGVNKLFVLVDSNQHANSKRFKTGRYYLRKRHYQELQLPMENGKTFMTNPSVLIQKDMKRDKKVSNKLR